MTTERTRQRWSHGCCALTLASALSLGSAVAQSLDMDTGATAAAPSAPALGGAGNLDMDVSPTTPVAGKPAPAALSTRGVRDGIAPLSTGVTQGVPATAAPPGSAGPSDPASNPAVTPASTTPATTAPETLAPALLTPTTLVPATAPPAAPLPGTEPAMLAPQPQAPQPQGPQPQAPQPQPLAPAENASKEDAPLPPPVSLEHPKAITTAQLEAGDKSVTLYGIVGLQEADMVQGFNGFLGASAGKVTCQAQTSADFVCLTPDGMDIAEAALRNGAARTKDDAPPPYRDQEAAAQADRRGIWANLPPPPVTIHRVAVPNTATLVADDKEYILDGIIGTDQPYASQLQGYIATNGDSLTCNPQPTPGTFLCVLNDGTDIAKVALVNGAARVGPGAPDSYRVQQGAALDNHRGIWATATPQMVAVWSVAEQPTCCVMVAGDDGVDGITYVAGEPTAVIGGETVFFTYLGAEAGWGYYDHYHHWHGAPDHFRHHLEHFHPDGHGLRGWGHEYGHVHEVAMRPGLEHAGMHPGMERPGFERSAMAGPMRMPAGMHPGMGASGMHPGMAAPGLMHPGTGAPGMMHPGVAGPGMRPGMGAPGMGAPGMMHSGMAAPGTRPGMGAPGMGMPGMRPGMGAPAMAGARPGGGVGFIHPGQAVGGFHPGGGGMPHVAAPAPHPSGGGGVKHK